MAKRKRRKAGKKASGNLPGWVHMLAGLAIGLTVAWGIYVSDRRQPPRPAPVAAEREPASSAPPEVAEIVPVEPDGGITFDFYDMLPNLDVELFDNPAAPKNEEPVRQATSRVVEKPGIYILQAGSFSELPVAQRRKAEIALLGVHTEIKKGNLNGRTLYRVYTDPMENPQDVNRVSALLNNAGIDMLLKRVSD